MANIGSGGTQATMKVITLTATKVRPETLCPPAAVLVAVRGSGGGIGPLSWGAANRPSAK